MFTMISLLYNLLYGDLHIKNSQKLKKCVIVIFNKVNEAWEVKVTRVSTVANRLILPTASTRTIWVQAHVLAAHFWSSSMFMPWERLRGWPNTWDPEPTWDIQRNSWLLDSNLPSSSHCSHIRSEPVSGRSLCLTFFLYTYLSRDK